MKAKIKTIIISMIMILVAFSSISIIQADDNNYEPSFSGNGSGTSGDPYQITNVDQLQEMENSLGSHYILMNDIDASETSSWNSGAGFDPVGNEEVNEFSGTLDGNGCTITGLYINRPSTDYVGLFGSAYEYNNIEIKDLHLRDVDITGNNYVGGITGRLERGEGIHDCSVTGDISGSYCGLIAGRTARSHVDNCWSSGTVSGSYAGGIVGYNFGNINYCNSSAVISGGSRVGGLVGYCSMDIRKSYSIGDVSGVSYVGGAVGIVYSNYYADVYDCYSTGDVSGTGNYVGGFTGRVYNSRVKYCYSTGYVSADDYYVGGFDAYSWDGSVSSCFWDTETSGQSDSYKATGKTTAEMQSFSTFNDAGWNIVNGTNIDTETWYVVDGSNYPHLSWTYEGVTPELVSPEDGSVVERQDYANLQVSLPSEPTGEMETTDTYDTMDSTSWRYPSSYHWSREWSGYSNCYGYSGYAVATIDNDKQGFDNYGFNIPDDADVTNVKIKAYTSESSSNQRLDIKIGSSVGYVDSSTPCDADYPEYKSNGWVGCVSYSSSILDWDWDVSGEGWKGSDINGDNLKVLCDTKYEIDKIYYVQARVDYTPAPAEPPELVSPEDGEVLDRQNYADLEVTADTTVSFYDASDDSLLGTDDTSDGGIYSYNWTGLTPGQTYSWYVSADGATSDTWSFTPNDEPEIQNLRIQEINSRNATFEWNNEINTEWISLKVGSDIMEVRRLTTTHQNWTVENLYPDYPYYFQWQIGDDLNSFSDYYEFDFRTDGWNPTLEDYSYRKLITIDSDDISSDQDDTAYFLNLTEDNFRYSSGDNWWDPTYPAFTHLDYTNYDDIRFTNYYDTNMLEYDITKWDIPGDGGLEEQTLPDEIYYTGSFINPSYAHDDDWTTKATPSTHGTLYYNYTIPADAKTTSKLRTYQGDWIWDITLSEGVFNGSKLQFKTICDYDVPYVSTYVWNYDTNDWELAQDEAWGSSNSTARYFYESMMTWEYDCEANIHVMTEHFDDDTRTYVDGVDGDYDVKFWMYYGNDNPSSDGPYDFVSYETADCTIGSEDSYQLPAPEIENVAVSDLTTSTANISFDTTEISDSYIDIAENEWILNSTIANRTIQRTEEFNHLSGDDEHTEQLGVFSPYFNQTISVVCSNTSYNTNYSVNSSTGDSPVEITFEDVNAGEFLNWTVTYSMFKVIERDETNHGFMLTELENNKQYYYRINASNNGGSDTHIGSFTLGTPPSTPDTNITTYTENRPDEKVTVTGELTDLDGASSVDIQIQYWKEGDTTFSWTPTVTLNSVDTFQENISVEYGNKYYYRVKAVGDTTGYSDAYSNLFMDIQEFFAGNYVEDDDNNDENEYGRSRQYLPTNPDGTVNESATAYEQTGYWEGSLQEEDWMWVETNINQNLPLTIKLYTKADGHVGDYTMNNDADSDMQYYKLENLENKWYTFHIVDSNTDMVLNWTKPSPIHNVGETRRDESKYVSFNGTPENIDYELLYMDYKFYNTSAYQYAINELGGDIYTAMSVEYFGGGRGAGIGPDVSGTAYDRGRLFRGGIINGELDDTGMLNPARPDLGEGAQRHCYAFTVYWWNKSIIPTNNIENYYYRYWTSNSWWSEYFGHPQTRTFDFNSLFSWGYDELSHTRDWKYIDDATITEETLVENVSASVFNSDYDQSLMIGYKDGFSVDTSDDKIYNMGMYTDGRWTNQQLGPHQQGYVVFNLPDNATLQAMDSDSDGLNDYEELFTYYTNPKCNDTDEDGQNDSFEVNSGVNPNLHTSYNKPPQITINSPYNDETELIGLDVPISADVIDLEGENKEYNISLWKDDVLQEYLETGTGDLAEVDWNTSTYTPGTYTVKIVAEDINQFSNNVTVDVPLKYHKMYSPTIPDDAEDISIYQTEEWEIYIDYALGPTFNWTIETSPDVGSNSGTDDTPGFKTITLTNLQPSTTYTIYVNATGSNTNETYDFNTSAEHVELDWNANLIDVKKGENVTTHLAVDPHGLYIDTVATDEIYWTESLLEYPDSSGVDWGNLFEETWAQINGTVDNTNGTITNVVWGNGDTNDSGILYYLNFTTGEGTGTATLTLDESMIGVAKDMADVNWSYLGGIDIFIHYYTPDAPTSFDAEKVSPSEINLSWVKDTSGNYGVDPDDGVGDRVIIERNTVSSWSMGSGTEIYNNTGTYFLDSGLSQQVTYYYQAWSWNATDNVYSPLNTSTSNTTGTLLPPSDFTVTATDSSYGYKELDLSWTKAEQADYTYIERMADPLPLINGTEQTYESYTVDNDGDYACDYVYWGQEEILGESFTTGTTGNNEDFILSDVKIKAFRDGSPGTIDIDIYETSGDYPTGNSLSHGTFNANSLTTDYTSGEWVTITMPSVTLNESTKYVLTIAIREVSNPSSNRLGLREDKYNSYSGGVKIYYDNGWNTPSGDDLLFEINGYNQTQSTSWSRGEGDFVYNGTASSYVDTGRVTTNTTTQVVNDVDASASCYVDAGHYTQSDPTSGSGVWMGGYDNDMGATIFRDVNIPDGSVITSATLQIYIMDGHDYGLRYVKIYGEEDSNPETIQAYSGYSPPSNVLFERTKTSAYVQPNDMSRPGNGWYTIPNDLSAIIQEIVDTEGGTSDIGLLWGDNDGGNYLYFNDYGSTGAKLSIEYEEGTPLDSHSQYHYQAWSYNASLDDAVSAWSNDFVSDENTTLNNAPENPINPSPADSANYESVYNCALNLTPYDLDLPDETFTVAFYFEDSLVHTATGIANNTATEYDLTQYITPDWLDHDTTYEWHVVVNDSIAETTGPTWTFDTSHYTDTNEDGTIDYLDVSYLSGYYRQTCLVGEYGWDIVEDGESNYLDVSALVSDYGETFP